LTYFDGIFSYSDTDTPEVDVNIAFHNGWHFIHGRPQGVLSKKNGIKVRQDACNVAWTINTWLYAGLVFDSSTGIIIIGEDLLGE
jgi:hypothetical protein